MDYGLWPMVFGRYMAYGFDGPWPLWPVASMARALYGPCPLWPVPFGLCLSMALGRGSQRRSPDMSPPRSRLVNSCATNSTTCRRGSSTKGNRRENEAGKEFRSLFAKKKRQVKKRLVERLNAKPKPKANTNDDFKCRHANIRGRKSEWPWYRR